MALDFTGLNSIAGAGQHKPPENSQKKPAQERIFGQGEYKNTSEPEKGAEGQETAKFENYGLQREADTRRDALQRAAEVYKHYQQATIATSGLTAGILTGIRSGQDIYSLFLKAAQIIALTTDNELFFDQIRQELPAIYGIGLQQAAPLRIELQAAQERLKKLETAEREAPA